MRPKRKIRVIHHMARSGGTILTRCLGAMRDTVMLSEVHPRGTGPNVARVSSVDQKVHNPIWQAQTWFKLFTDAEYKELMAQYKNVIDAEMFPYVIELIANAIRKEKFIVLRDWSHLDYTGIPYVKKPLYRPSIVDVLEDRFEVIRYASARHPIYQWISLSRLKVIADRLKIDDFLYGYFKFADMAKEIGFIRYEDFTDDPDGKLQILCRGLDLPFDPDYRHYWMDYAFMTGDINKKIMSNKREIVSANTRKIPPKMLETFERNDYYHASLALLGYRQS
ncbi:MAG: hypothetical protein SWH61_06415 [Thermodesulfobacteriota bacterium]|nr:hypothetical protein [Thermodesulfobacteriota bacterium]